MRGHINFFLEIRIINSVKKYTLFKLENFIAQEKIEIKFMLRLANQFYAKMK